MAGGVFQDAADLARVFLRSAGAGIPELAQRTFGDPTVADRTDAQVAQARARAGYAGDLASTAGYLAPGLGGPVAAWKGIRALPALVRGAPKLAESLPEIAQVARAGLANLAGPSITKAELAARLAQPVGPSIGNAFRATRGLEPLAAEAPEAAKYIPTLAERALGAAGRAAAATAAVPLRHPWITAGTLLGSLGASAVRNNSGTPAAKAAPASSASSSGSGDFSPEPLPQAPPPHSNPDFSALASMVAKGNGGKISIRELSALADIAAKTSPRQAPAKPPTPAEIAAQRALQLGEPYYQSKINSATSQKDADDAYQKTLEFYKELAKARPYDPASSMGYGFPGDDN